MKKRSIHTMALYREDRLSAVPLMTLNNRQDATDSPASEKEWSDQELEEFSRDPLEGVLMQMRLWPQTISRQQCVRSVVFVSTICLCTGFFTAYVLFFLLYPPAKPCPLMKNGDAKISSRIISEIQADQIQTFIRELNLKAESENGDLSFYILQQLNNSGLDEVKIVPYNVTISHQVRITDNDKIVFNAMTVTHGKIVSSSQRQTRFSEDLGSTLKNELIIFVNYGLPEDYEVFTQHVNGSVVLIKSRKMMESSAISLAKQKGASAIILYSDPFDISYDEPVIYPNSISVADPEKEGVRMKRHTELNHVPIFYITCDDANKLFRLLGSHDTSVPQPLTVKHPQKLEIIHKKQTLQLNNVIGILHGSREIDRYILVGSKQKSLKTSSNSISTLLELARVFGKLKNTGWHPYRSIMFCFWSEPLPGLIGSVKWTEEFSKILVNRAVAYINVDTRFSENNELKIYSSPLLWNSLEEAAKKIQNPYNSSKLPNNAALYDVWMQNLTKVSEEKDKKLHWALPSATSTSYNSFFHFLGISTVEVNFDVQKNPESDTVSPVSTISSNDEVTSLKDLKIDIAITQFLGEVTRMLSDSLILPFDTRNYARYISEAFFPLNSENGLLSNFEAIASQLKSTIINFNSESNKFQDHLHEVDKANPFAIRIMNDQLLQLERTFIRSQGLSCNPANRHILVSPVSSSDNIANYLIQMLKETEEMQKESSHEKIKEDLSDIVFHLQLAINALKLNL